MYGKVREPLVEAEIKFLPVKANNVTLLNECLDLLPKSRGNRSKNEPPPLESIYDTKKRKC